jgi:alpha-tubulin suppressor-like RCC1 family protein
MNLPVIHETNSCDGKYYPKLCTFNKFMTTHTRFMNSKTFLVRRLGWYWVLPLILLTLMRPCWGGIFVEVGIHPEASTLRNVTARTLSALEPWNGKLYAGYGDYDHEWSPLKGVWTFDPETRNFTKVWTSGGLALPHFRPIRGGLYVPWHDSLMGGLGGRGIIEGGVEQWRNVPGSALHLYDVATLDGNDLWFAGTSSSACLWRSLDDGQTWQSISFSNSGWTPGSFMEACMFLGVYKGKLYVQTSYEGWLGQPSRVFNGTTWSTGPNLVAGIASGFRPTTFADKMIYLGQQSWYLEDPSSRPMRNLKAFDGTTAAIVQVGVFDYRVADGKLYTLGLDSVIRSTTNLSSWTVVATAPSTSRCLGILNGKLYVGTNDSKIYEYSDVLYSKPSVLVTATDAVAYENGSDKQGSFTFTRSGSTAASLTVPFTIGGSASAGSDYGALPSSITIPAGHSSMTLTVTLLNDSANESNEKITVQLNANSAYEVSEPSFATIRVYDDERPTVSIVANDSTATEAGLTPGQLTVTRYGSTATSLSVSYLRMGTAVSGTDYVPLAGRVTIPAGASSATILVEPLDDSIVENPETVSPRLGLSTLYNIGESGQATVTILDNDTSNVTPPSAPGSLVVTGVSSSQIQLSWLDLSINETGFKIERKTGSAGTYSQIAMVSAGVVTYLNTGLTSSTQYSYRVRASNGGGDSAYTNEAVATTGGSSNAAPVVSAGADQTITLPATASLSGAVTDDGLPSGTLTKAWSKVSGTGTVTFGNGSVVSTTASFSSAGTYVLRLTANDGVLSASDDVTVIVSVTPPPTVSTIAGALSGGEAHSLALKSDGTVYAWGLGRYGQLGRGNTNSSLVAVAIPNFNAVEVASGRFHSVAVRSDGSVWTWGYNVYGQLGIGTTVQTTSPVRVNGISAAVAIAGGYHHTAAVTADGKVWTWGTGSFGQLGNGTTNRIQKTPVQVLGLVGLSKDVAAGMHHTLSVQSDGTVWAWGYNKFGQLGQGSTNEFRNTAVKVPGLNGVTRVAAGDYFSAALKSDGTVWAWGHNGSGRLGDGTSVGMRTNPAQVINLTNVAEIYAGLTHMVAVKNDGSVWTWGANNVGQLGVMGISASTKPVQVGNLSSVVGVGAGLSHSLVLKGDGTVWSWGRNHEGQLGHNSKVNTSNAVQVSGLDLIE